MADYWKSNPRKFCEVCKCWLADNKASIEFHEGGRRHQANAKKRLQDARTRSAESAKEKLSIEKTVNAIEQAALNAYQQDLAGGKVKKAKPKAPISAEAEQLLQIQDFLALEQQKVEKELEKKKIEANAQQKIQEIQTKALETAYEAYSSSYAQAQAAASWQQSYSPEGYPYYYNTATGVTQWEMPPGFQAAAAIYPPPVGATTPTSAPIPVEASSQSPSSTAASSQPVKRSSEEAGLENHDSHQRPKRTGPYGGWTTVAVIERDPEAEEEAHKDEEAGEENAEEGKEEFQFEEKKMSGGLIREEEEEEGSGELKGDFKGFSFKKRLNKGRPQIRQRTRQDSKRAEMSTQRAAGYEEWENPHQWMDYDAFDEGGGSSVASDLSLNDRAVHVDFFNDFDELFDDQKLD